MHIALNSSPTPQLAEVIPPKMRGAVAKALTGTAWDVRDALVEGMRRSFDRPNQFTLNAFRVTPATSADMTATIWAMPLQARYLFWEIEGGERHTKAFEYKFGRSGGEVVIPSPKSQTDQNGNLSRAMIGKMLADMNSGGTSKRFFIGTPKGRGSDGIWARVGNNKRLVRVAEFAEKAEYKPRFLMSAIADETVNTKWESQIMRALKAGLE